jgi:hypothetical protein
MRWWGYRRSGPACVPLAAARGQLPPLKLLLGPTPPSGGAGESVRKPGTRHPPTRSRSFCRRSSPIAGSQERMCDTWSCRLPRLPRRCRSHPWSDHATALTVLRANATTEAYCTTLMHATENSDPAPGARRRLTTTLEIRSTCPEGVPWVPLWPHDRGTGDELRASSPRFASGAPPLLSGGFTRAPHHPAKHTPWLVEPGASTSAQCAGPTVIAAMRSYLTNTPLEHRRFLVHNRGCMHNRPLPDCRPGVTLPAGVGPTDLLVDPSRPRGFDEARTAVRARLLGEATVGVRTDDPRVPPPTGNRLGLDFLGLA